jgi:CheY-like chemotaxis protein
MLRVLLVERTNHGRQEIADILLDAGYLVFCALNATEVLDYEGSGLTWDAMVFDVRRSEEDLGAYIAVVSPRESSPIIAVGLTPELSFGHRDTPRVWSATTTDLVGVLEAALPGGGSRYGSPGSKQPFARGRVG